MTEGLFGTEGEAASIPSVFKFSRFSQPIRPQLDVGGVPHVLEELHNQGFLAITEKLNAAVAAGMTLPWTLKMPQGEVFTGSAELISQESRRRGCRLGFVFRSGRMDPHRVFVETQAAQLLAWVRQTRDPAASGIDTSYRAFCADVVARLNLYRKTLEEMASTGAETHVLDECTEELIGDWDEWSRRALLSIGEISRPEEVQRYRDFTALTVTPHLTAGPAWQRAFAKPRGYPGDYGVMHYLYERKDEGSSLYGKLCHRLGLHFGKCVPSRKDFIRRSILARLESRRHLATTSIACGPAQEIVDMARSMSSGCHLQATLLDQDPEAIRFATTRIAEATTHAGGTLAVETRCHQFGDLSDRASNVVPAAQDIIYCFGMYDYLPDDVVRPITELLYERVKPGGLLILGNLAATTRLRWGLSFVLGYDMWYRSREEMLAWADDLPGAEADLQLEETGNNYLLYLHKR